MQYTQGGMGRAPAEDQVELDEKLVMGDGGDNTEEINTVIPTGFCSQQEVKLMRKQQRLLGHIRYLEDRINRELEDGRIDLNDFKQDIVQAMNFVAHSSKSLDGSAFKAAKTQRVIQREDLFQRQEQAVDGEKGLMKKLQEQLKKSAQAQGQSNQPILPQPQGRNDQW